MSLDTKKQAGMCSQGALVFCVGLPAQASLGVLCVCVCVCVGSIARQLSKLYMSVNKLLMCLRSACRYVCVRADTGRFAGGWGERCCMRVRVGLVVVHACFCAFSSVCSLSLTHRGGVCVRVAGGVCVCACVRACVRACVSAHFCIGWVYAQGFSKLWSRPMGSCTCMRSMTALCRMRSPCAGWVRASMLLAATLRRSKQAMRCTT